MTDLRAQVVEAIAQVMWDSGTAEAALDAALGVLDAKCETWWTAFALIDKLRAGKGSDE